MNLLAIAGLSAFFPTTVLGIFTMIKRQKMIHVLWSFFCFSVALWGLGIYKIATTQSAISSIFWWRIAEIGVIFIPVLLFHFTLSFFDIRKKWFTIIFYIATFVFLYLDLFTNYFVNQVYFAFNQFYYISATPVYSLFIIIFCCSAFYSVFKLWKEYGTRKGIIRSQIRYLAIGFAIGFGGGLTSYFPVYHINIYPAWNAAIFISALMVSYAILKYRMMDIRFALSRLTVYILSFLTVLSFAFFSIFLGNKFADLYPLSIPGYFVLGLILTASTLLYSPVSRFFEKFASKYFYYTFYNYQNVLAELGEKLTRVLDLNELSFLITDTLLKTIKLNKIAIFLKNGTFQAKGFFGFERKITDELGENSFLIERLAKLKMPISIEELSLIDIKNSEEKEKVEKFKSEMQKAEVELCLPLLLEEKLVGMIVLGSKISGDAYFKQDMDLLSALASQASIALQNARLYSEVKGFSVKLEKEVADRTEELKMANEELKKLDHVKTEFLSITSHQLKTPLAAIKGYSSLLLDGTYGKITEKATEPVKNIHTINEGLISLITDLLDITRMDMGKMVFDFKEVAVEVIIDDLVNELKVIAQKKNLYLQWEKPIDFPKIIADDEKIRQVFLNMIDNAVKYTKTGGVIVKAEKIDSKIKIEVSDTGLGIKKEETESIFKGFDRGQNVQKAQIEGTGLGLMFARRIVDAHKGKIWAESDGENTGSTFFVELPIKK